jgi:hypothetical protein
MQFDHISRPRHEEGTDIVALSLRERGLLAERADYIRRMARTALPGRINQRTHRVGVTFPFINN